MRQTQTRSRRESRSGAEGTTEQREESCRGTKPKKNESGLGGSPDKASLRPPASSPNPSALSPHLRENARQATLVSAAAPAHRRLKVGCTSAAAVCPAYIRADASQSKQGGASSPNALAQRNAQRHQPDWARR